MRVLPFDICGGEAIIIEFRYDPVHAEHPARQLPIERVIGLGFGESVEFASDRHGLGQAELSGGGVLEHSYREAVTCVGDNASSPRTLLSQPGLQARGCRGSNFDRAVAKAGQVGHVRLVEVSTDGSVDLAAAERVSVVELRGEGCVDRGASIAGTRLG